jgi:hypothetical protein
MVLTGRIQNGMVVLDGNPPVPEGAIVAVTIGPTSLPKLEFTGTTYIDLPIINAGPPGSLQLTAEKIAEILDAEDAAPRR